MSGTMTAMRARTTSVWTLPRERRAMRQKLLEIARRLIARDGEDAVTLSAIANEADIAHATIYGYFSSKREMLTALASLPTAPSAADQAPAPETPPTEPENSPAQALECAPEPQDVAHAAPTEEADIPVLIASDDPEDTVPWNDGATPEEALSPESPERAPEPIEALAVAESGREQEAPEIAEEASEALHEPVAVDDVSYFDDDASVYSPDSGAQESASEQQPAQDAFDPILPNFEKRRAQAAQLDTIARHLVLPEGGGRDGTDALINRLETRLRVIEGSITSLEAKHNALEAWSGNQVNPVSEQIEHLLKRSEAFEARHMKTLSELRLEIHQLGSRPTSIPNNSAVTEELAWSPPVQEPEPAAPPAMAVEEPLPESDAAEPEGSIADEGRHAYLSAVRSLAKEGARQAAERESAEEAEKDIRRRKVYVAAGVAIACIGVVGLLFKFHPGSHGVSSAQSRVTPQVAVSAARTPLPIAAVPNAPAAPLDQLAARANKGDARAELVIGLKYLSGDGVAANDARAARWLSRAANGGNAVAQNHLGALYQSGRGVTRDIAQAKHWYEAAAAQGDRHAMSNLAVLYAGGSGEGRDYATAARWFQRSASLGYVDAQFNLAVLFERGDGVPQSLLDAYRWYSIAAASGDAVAKTRAGAIATQISPEELQAAQRAVALFKPHPLNRAANDVPTMQDVLASR